MNITDEIALERCRQIEGEGWSLTHDDEHDRAELACAAAAYLLLHAAKSHIAGDQVAHILQGAAEISWPWNINERRSKIDRRTLVIAAALIVAEIERLDRAVQ